MIVEHVLNYGAKASQACVIVWLNSHSKASNLKK